MDNAVRQYIVDKETGKIVDEIRAGDKYQIIRDEKIKFLAKQSELIEFLPNARFVKVYTDPLHELKKSLSGAEMMFIIELLEFISYETGILQHSNGRPLKRTTIAEITNMDVKSVDRVIKSLTKKEVLGKHKTGKDVCFSVNPYLFCRGKMVSKTLLKLYERSRWANIYRQNNKKVAN